MKVDAQCFRLLRGHFQVWVKYKIIVFTAFTNCKIFNYANFVLYSYLKMTSKRLKRCDFSVLTFITNCISKKFQMKVIDSNND